MDIRNQKVYGWLIKKEIPSLGHSTEAEGDDSVFVNRMGNVVLVCDYARDKNNNKMVGYALVWTHSRDRDEYILNNKGGILEGSNETNSIIWLYWLYKFNWQ